MTWIGTVPEDEATGLLKGLYEQEIDLLGFVLQATKSLSVRPELAEAYEKFRQTVWGTPGLTRRERRLINLLIAHRVRSRCCALVYAAAVERDLGGPAVVRVLLEDHQQAPLSAREMAILDYALAAATGHPDEGLVVRLRDAGLDDGAILDVAFTACLRLCGSRVYAALGVEPDSFFLDQTDLTQAISVEAPAISS